MNTYQLGHAAVLLACSLEKRGAEASQPELSYGLKGRLHLSHSGWILLTVPNALGRGAYEALNEPGTELPTSETTGRYNAHISVIREEELEQIGGGNKIHERGQEFGFTLGPVRKVNPQGWNDVSECWFIEVRSPELEKLRKSYGLSALPKDGEFKFHITFAVRRKGVTRANGPAMHRVADLIYRPSTLFQDDYRRKTAVAKEAGIGYRIAPSSVHGEGVFASRNFDPGDDISLAMQRLPDNRYVRTEVGRKVNHAKSPNTFLQRDGDGIYVIADEPIAAGEEILVDYEDAYENVLGNDVQFEDGSGRIDNEELFEKRSQEVTSSLSLKKELSAVVRAVRNVRGRNTESWYATASE